MAQRAIFLELQSQASVRIEKTFGLANSRPIVAFFSSSKTFWPLKLNDFGSAPSIGNYGCVMIGPKGQNVDVVAHELMHQELHDRVGSWRMLTEVPVWFNEGVAMQLDFRPRYSLAEKPGHAPDTSGVRELKLAHQFNHGNGEQVTQHYAFAKAEIARWLSNVGHDGLYRSLERIRAGERFDDVLAN